DCKQQPLYLQPTPHKKSIYHPQHQHHKSAIRL
ncbi:hypothetical protein AVDCRST_MAG92-3178, partial [uncultured Coleofasciculus sp.]